MMRWQDWWLGLGLLVWLLAIANVGWGHRSFVAHMIEHMTAVTVGGTALGLGLAGGRWDLSRRIGRRMSPLIASFAEFGVVYLWHLPQFHLAAGSSPSLAAFEVSSFVLAGYLLAVSIAGGEEGDEGWRVGSGILAVLLTCMHMTLLGVLLLLSPRALYSEHGMGGNALEDQQAGAVVMLVWGGGTYLVAAIVLSLRILAPRRASTRGTI